MNLSRQVEGKQKTPPPTKPQSDLSDSRYRSWLRVITSFPSLLTVLVIGIVFICSVYRPEMNDPDIWWHLRNAQYLVQNHHFVRQDMYSFTVAGHQWVDTEWLSEVVYYASYKALGLTGLRMLEFAVLCATFLFLLYLCYRQTRNFKASALACYCAIVLATVSFGPRTILFGYLYLVFLLIILERFRRIGDAPLWSLPVLFCLWANTHGSWSLGLIVFFLFAISGLFSGSWARIEAVRWTGPQIKKLAFTGVASVAALFANPYGWRLVYYPFDLAFRQKLNIGHVQEWAAVNFHDGRGKFAIFVVAALIAGALVRNRRWYVSELLLLLFGLYCGLTYIRFLALFGILAAPVFAKMLDFLPPYRRTADIPAINAVLLAAAIALMVFFWPRESRVHKSIEETYPAGAVAYLQAHPAQGNVLNFYLWGGYLGWHDPQIKDFIDSRVDIFEYAGVLKEYLDLLGADDLQHRPDAILATYRIRYVLFPPSDSKNPLHNAGKLVEVLQHDPRWKTIYQDKTSVLLERE